MRHIFNQFSTEHFPTPSTVSFQATAGGRGGRGAGEAGEAGGQGRQGRQGRQGAFRGLKAEAQERPPPFPGCVV